MAGRDTRERDVGAGGKLKAPSGSPTIGTMCAGAAVGWAPVKPGAVLRHCQDGPGFCRRSIRAALAFTVHHDPLPAVEI